MNDTDLVALLKRISAEDHSAPEVGYDPDGEQMWTLDWRSEHGDVTAILNKGGFVWTARTHVHGSTIDGLMNALTRFNELAADETILR